MSFRGLACGALLLLRAAAQAGDTAAVLSYEGGAYLEAYAAFKSAYAGQVSRYPISLIAPELSEDTHTIVAFGAKAAGYKYPREADLVYCMAPAVNINPPGPGKAVKISLIPDFRELFSSIRRVQPGIKRLWVFWMASDFGQYAGAAKAEGERQGVLVTSVQVISLDRIPGLLRQLANENGAFWIPPDPMLLGRENLAILKDFSWSNGIPFYGSTKGTTREGAVASVGMSFAEIGRAAAKAAQSLRAGEPLPAVIFPDKPELTLNTEAARKLGFKFTPETLSGAAYVFP